VIHLLDSNVLIALTVEDHVHQQAADRWWTTNDAPFATCPITQAALVRLLLREGISGSDGARVLALFTAHPRHIFWPDALDYTAVDLTALVGHRQVTDAYLAALARHHGARLATFDRGLAHQHEDVATLIPLADHRTQERHR